MDIIGELPRKMRGQKWEDHAAEVAAKEAQKQAARDLKLGIKRVVQKQVAADTTGLTHTPKPSKVVKAKRKKRRRTCF